MKMAKLALRAQEAFLNQLLEIKPNRVYSSIKYPNLSRFSGAKKT
jgi:hypothetical protein